MAEAAVEQQLPSRYYCHQCSEEIAPNIPAFTCPVCNSGFIELMGEDFDEESDQATPPLDPAAQFSELWERTFMDSFRLHTNGEDENSTNDDPDRDRDETEPSQNRSNTRHRHRQMFLPRTRVSIRRNRHDRGPALEGIINQLLGSIAGGSIFQTDGLPVGMFHLHASPGDYAWGAEGLDAIVTQLLNQLDGQGAPPASKQQIQDLPSVNITQEQVDKTLQCTVCMDDFNLNETVRKLPCDHYYHTDCIVPWLERHGSCPICRKDLNGQDTSQAQLQQNGGSSVTNVNNYDNENSMFDEFEED